MSEQYYKFKHSNVSLGDYINDRKFTANLKRREAQVLNKEADAIDGEMWELESSLLPVTQPPQDITTKG